MTSYIVERKNIVHISKPIPDNKEICTTKM